jgi:hypothetical protein
VKPELIHVSSADARSRIRKELGFPTHDQVGSVVTPELCAAALRSALWSFWASEQRPIYITRLLGAATRMLLPWQSDDEALEQSIPDQLRAALQELDVLGDLAALPNGRWAPAPTRVVRLPATGKYLLLSGVPTEVLPPAVKAALAYNGVARLMNDYRAISGLHAPELPIQEWLRLPDESLADWTCNVLNAVHFEPPGELQVEVYAPQLASPRDDHYFRWRQLTHRMADGRYLARARLRRGSMMYYIAQVSSGSLVAVGTPNFGDGDVRRFMYGLDLLAHRPVRVSAKRNRKQWSFTLRSELPRAEYRQFMTIGTERLPTDGKYYPRWWDVPSAHVPEAERVLRNLGIEVEIR